MNHVADLILKEGQRVVVTAFASALVLALLGLDCLAGIALLAGTATAWNYRRPVRGSTHFERGSVLAPCDGKVAAITTEPSGILCVEIVSGCLDASLLTMPFEGRITKNTLTRGARLGRTNPLAPLLNEQASLTFEDRYGHRVKVVHTATYTPAALLIDRIDPVAVRPRGARYGISTHGVTRLYFPSSSRVAVNSGERVTGGETLLGYVG